MSDFWVAGFGFVCGVLVVAVAIVFLIWLLDRTVVDPTDGAGKE